ncbi:hypothetical protein [Streptomyces sp. NPDC088350]|uniref:hypothetical protein n=1 Tax=Streptomyces sp. NPDC088350 TaxID=3365854 RepID=UPI003805D871
MSNVPQTPTAILLITVWLEPGSPVLRARMTSTVDARAPGTSLAASGREAVLAKVGDWLEAREAELNH